MYKDCAHDESNDRDIANRREYHRRSAHRDSTHIDIGIGIVNSCGCELETVWPGPSCGTYVSRAMVGFGWVRHSELRIETHWNPRTLHWFKGMHGSPSCRPFKQLINTLINAKRCAWRLQSRLKLVKHSELQLTVILHYNLITILNPQVSRH